MWFFKFIGLLKDFNKTELQVETEGFVLIWKLPDLMSMF